jgi:hypothetical protein
MVLAPNVFTYKTGRVVQFNNLVSNCYVCHSAFLK